MVNPTQPASLRSILTAASHVRRIRNAAADLTVGASPSKASSDQAVARTTNAPPIQTVRPGRRAFAAARRLTMNRTCARHAAIAPSIPIAALVAIVRLRKSAASARLRTSAVPRSTRVPTTPTAHWPRGATLSITVQFALTTHRWGIGHALKTSATRRELSVPVVAARAYGARMPVIPRLRCLASASDTTEAARRAPVTVAPLLLAMRLERS